MACEHEFTRRVSIDIPRHWTSQREKAIVCAKCGLPGGMFNYLNSRSDHARTEQQSQDGIQKLDTVTQSNAKTVDRQNEANDTRGVQSGIRDE